MRVLHMIPDIGVSNGVMSVILNYAKAMPKKIKFDVIYFAENEKTRQKDIESLGGRVFKTDRPSPLNLISHKMDGFFSVHNNEWQALHIHCPHFAVFIAPAAKRAGIKNIIVHCHTTEFSLNGNSSRNKILSLYSRFFIKNRIACSTESGKLWYSNKKFTVLNNAVDCEKYAYNSEIRNDFRNKMDLNDSFTICHIGRTSVRQKNHPFILQIFSQIKKRKPRSKLMLIGGEKTEELLNICHEFDFENDVMFLGARNDVADLLQAADLFLFPSTSEGLPVSVIEAQAAGLPVLMSDSITNEVAVTDLVISMSLNDSAEKWAEKAVEISNGKREDTFEILKQSGWDIFDCAKRLASFYENGV